MLLPYQCYMYLSIQLFAHWMKKSTGSAWESSVQRETDGTEVTGVRKLSATQQHRSSSVSSTTVVGREA